MIKKENTIDMLTTIKIPCILFVVFLIAIISCDKQSQDFDIKIDLAKEMGANMFSPNEGDSIFIVGNFNDWDNKSHPLSESKNEWIYGTDIKDIVDLSSSDVQPFDTLEFKFYIKSDNPSKLLNTGWESIENRKYMIGEVLIEKPTLLYNDINQVEEKRDVTFTVGMSNQKVLGFFEPDSGDLVVVTGSFLDWDPIGIPLERGSRKNVYSVTIPIVNDEIEYKYRILTKRKNTHPEQGWERGVNRYLGVEKDNTEFSNFDNISRVARFIVSTENINKNREFDSNSGDQLQIKLKIDGRELLSDYMYQVGSKIYETAIVIPPNAVNIEWKLVKNLSEDLSTYSQEIIPIEGLVINVRR